MQKTSLDYLLSSYCIWRMISYYQQLFEIVPIENAIELDMHLLQRDGISFLRCKAKKMQPISQTYSPNEMKDILNEWICVFLRDMNVLPIYSGGCSMFDIVEPLYVDTITSYTEYYLIDILYIENTASFSYYKQCQHNNCN